MPAGSLDALFAGLERQLRETSAFAYLGPGGVLLGLRHTPALGASSVTVPLRRVAADAMALGVDAVVMAHNHPSGDPSPSATDRAATHHLAHVLDALGVRLAEHVIVAGKRRFSLRAAGMV